MMKHMINTLLIAITVALPFSAYARPDIDDITMEVMEGRDDRSDDVMERIELPEHEEREGKEDHGDVFEPIDDGAIQFVKKFCGFR